MIVVVVIVVVVAVVVIVVCIKFGFVRSTLILTDDEGCKPEIV
jgi:hypothetical protein